MAQLIVCIADGSARTPVATLPIHEVISALLNSGSDAVEDAVGTEAEVQEFWRNAVDLPEYSTHPGRYRSPLNFFSDGCEFHTRSEAECQCWHSMLRNCLGDSYKHHFWVMVVPLAIVEKDIFYDEYIECEHLENVKLLRT